MVDTGEAEAFIERYRDTFQSFDVDSIAGFFAFPCLVVGEAESVSVVSVPAADAWTPQIARIVGAYRLLGVERAEILRLETVAVTSRVSHVVVSWVLRGAGVPIYDFTASYTVVDTGDGLRIVAIAHDETPKLMAAVARAQAG